MSFVIDRSKWSRGEASLLLDDCGNYCAVGAYLLSEGVAPSRLQGRGSVDGLGISPPEPFCVLRQFDPAEPPEPVWSDQIHVIIKANDDTALDDHDRENQIRQGFAEVGVDMEFV